VSVRLMRDKALVNANEKIQSPHNPINSHKRCFYFFSCKITNMLQTKNHGINLIIINKFTVYFILLF